MSRWKWTIPVVAALSLAACGQPATETASGPEGGGVINLYTARHYDADRLIYDAFAAETGIRVNLIEANPDLLIERMRSEGAGSPADVVMMADAGALWRAQEAGLLQPLQSEVLEARIPAQLREEGGRWFGFSRRARVIAYDKEKVSPEEVATYEQLAGERFRGKLCIRTSDNVYNQSTLAALIEAWGEERATEWARAIVANMARQPQGGDRDQIKGVAAGVCEAALTNSYYYLQLINSGAPEDAEVQPKVELSFPSLEGAGTLVNVSGAGLAVYAPNRDNAVRFLEFMANDQSQRVFSEANMEYPAVTAVAAAEKVAAYANFTANPLSSQVYGQRQAQAQAIFDQVGWR